MRDSHDTRFFSLLKCSRSRALVSRRVVFLIYCLADASAASAIPPRVVRVPNLTPPSPTLRIALGFHPAPAGDAIESAATTNPPAG